MMALTFLKTLPWRIILVIVSLGVLYYSFDRYTTLLVNSALADQKRAYEIEEENYRTALQIEIEAQRIEYEGILHRQRIDLIEKEAELSEIERLVQEATKDDENRESSDLLRNTIRGLLE